MSTRVPVSVLIPIKNEAANLPRCLGCVSWADEIIVVDSQSTDGSIEIAEKHGAETAALKATIAEQSRQWQAYLNTLPRQ